MEDFRYRLYLRRKAEEGIRAIERGETYTQGKGGGDRKVVAKVIGQSPP